LTFIPDSGLSRGEFEELCVLFPSVPWPSKDLHEVCLGHGLDDEWLDVGGDLGSLTLSCNLPPPLVAADARAVTIAPPEPGFFPPPK